jgi:hypothetical protein
MKPVVTFQPQYYKPPKSISDLVVPIEEEFPLKFLGYEKEDEAYSALQSSSSILSADMCGPSNWYSRVLAKSTADKELLQHGMAEVLLPRLAI